MAGAAPSPNSQVRAIASLKLQKLATRLRAEVGRTESDQAQHTLIAADIKRFLERPAEVAKMIPTAGAPPGAPIGDLGQDWLAHADLVRVGRQRARGVAVLPAAVLSRSLRSLNRRQE